MKTSDLLAFGFTGVPFLFVIAMTMQVPKYDPWAMGEDGPKGDQRSVLDTTQPDRWGSIKLDGKPLDDATSGTLVVKAMWGEEKIPLQTPIDMSAFKNCASPLPVFKEAAQVNPDRSVPWVFAYVSKGLASGLDYGKPRPEQVEQLGCVYRPHVLGLYAKQELWIQNAEPKEGHNVKGMKGGTTLFNDAQSALGPTLMQSLTPNMGYSLQCEIHPWMKAWVNVLDHPYFATTENTYKNDEKGVPTAEVASCLGEIKRLPPGDYTVTAWHPSFGAEPVVVKVVAGQKVEVVFSVKSR